jgi:hypothetical protein
MATLSLTIPDALVDDLAQGIAFEMSDSADTAAATVAGKLVRHEAVTGGEKQALAQAWMKGLAKDVLIQQRVREAAETARTNPNDPAVTW